MARSPSLSGILFGMRAMDAGPKQPKRYCLVPECGEIHFTHGKCKGHWFRSPEERERGRIKRGTVGSRYSSLKRKAIRYSRNMNLSRDEYTALVLAGACHYCQAALPRVGHGIDRLDHTIGYVRGNCVPSCAKCNMAKGMLEAAGFKYPRTVELIRELSGK